MNGEKEEGGRVPNALAAESGKGGEHKEEDAEAMPKGMTVLGEAHRSGGCA